MAPTFVCGSVHEHKQTVRLVLVTIKKAFDHSTLVKLHPACLCAVEQVSPNFGSI